MKLRKGEGWSLTSTRKASLAGLLVGAVLAAAALVLAARRPMKADVDQLVAPILPESERALRQVVLHYVPSQDELVDETYTDFLRAVSDKVSVVMVTARGHTPAERQLLQERLHRIDPTGGLQSRTRIVESAGPITTWSKDRALVSDRVGGKPAWVIAPSEPSRDWEERYNDWQTVASLAAASQGQLRAKIAPFDFDAGDFMVDGDTIIVDTNLLEKNRHRGIADAAELRRKISAWFRAKVHVLGQEPGDTPRHHIAMYMTPLQRGTVLVGDPKLAKAIVTDSYLPGETSAESQEPLRPDFSDEMQGRFDRAAVELKRLGYRVERIPNLPFDHKTYFSYTNGVFEERDNQRVAYMPVYGHAELDAAARKIYEGLGWTVKPIRVQKVYKYHGTIGCLVNVLEREK